MDDPGCVRPNTIITAGFRLPDGTFRGGQVTSTYFRIRVDTETASPVVNCRGRLIAITRDGATILQGENLALPFASHGMADALAKRIDPGVPEYLDLIAITADGHVLIATPNFIVPSAIKHTSYF